MSAKVLFVDDDDANLAVSEAACGDYFEVLTASSAEVALQHMRAQEVGVVIADQRMPGVTGLELLERVSLEFPYTTRILITAYGDIQAAIEAINRGRVRRYLRKPWEPDELRAELRDALDLYAMKRMVSAMEVRLRETERVYALGIVAASIAHDLKDPLAWVGKSLSFAQTALHGMARDAGSGSQRARLEEIEACLTDTRTGIDRVADIVRSVEMPVRAESGALETVDLAEVLRLSLRLVTGELMRCASLELDVTSAPKVQGSATKLGQVVLNLIVNAMQAIAERPRSQNVISVRLKLDGAWAVLEVADNGPGIAEQDLSRIFDPFFTSKQGVGTGLGLAISRRIVEELDGSLGAGRDERLGGARFSMRLPI